MTPAVWLLCAAGLAALGAGGWALWRARRTVRRLDRMLAAAIDGGFVEELYDETALSSLEGRMARLLQGSAAANRALAHTGYSGSSGRWISPAQTDPPRSGHGHSDPPPPPDLPP